MADFKLRLIKVGHFYVVDGEPIPEAILNAPLDASPFDVAWELREEARRKYGDDFADDTYPDEPVRRTVGRKPSSK